MLLASLIFNQQQAMDTVLSQMDIDDPSANVDKFTEMGDVAPRAVQKQEKQKKDKTEKKGKKKGEKDKKAKSREDDSLETKKRKHVEVNGDVGTDGKKKKKKKSTIE